MTSTNTTDMRSDAERIGYVHGRLSVLVERMEDGNLTDPGAIVERLRSVMADAVVE